MPQPFKVVTETEAVFLNGFVTHLRDDVVEDRVGLAKIDDFHWFFEIDFRKSKVRIYFQSSKFFLSATVTLSSAKLK